MTGRLQGRVAIVTGGTVGIGRATVELFAQEGARVVFTGRRREVGEAVAAEIGRGAEFIACDATDDAAVRAMIEGTAGRHGRIDVLFNNASIPGPVGRIDEISIEEVDAQYRGVLRTVIFACRCVAPIMRRQRFGSIINNSSVAAHRAGFSSMIYGVFKAPVSHLTRALAVDLGEYGVRVNAISPGPVATGMYGRLAGLAGDAAEQAAERVLDTLARATPIPRACLPEDVARVALFLASDDASYVNGTDTLVDGGLIQGRRQSEAMAGAETLFRTIRGEA